MSLQAPPHPQADSYVTLAAAGTYLGARSAAWTAAGNAQREQALRDATRVLDSLPWKGRPTYSLGENRLRWPRMGVQNADGLYLDGTTVPEAIQQAAAELAALMLSGDVTSAGTSAAAASGSAISGVKVGEIEVSYDTAQTVSGSGFSAGHDSIVDLLIAPYVDRYTGAARLVR